jgi:hypothetical protein
MSKREHNIDGLTSLLKKQRLSSPNQPTVDQPGPATPRTMPEEVWKSRIEDAVRGQKLVPALTRFMTDIGCPWTSPDSHGELVNTRGRLAGDEISETLRPILREMVNVIKNRDDIIYKKDNAKWRQK